MLTSCSEWLDVKPISQVDGEEQISTAIGFQEILDGAYIAMAGQELYGKELSYGLIEEVALNHYYSSYKYPLMKWNYENEASKSRTEGVFLNAYKVIGNLNFLLDNIDEKKSLFTEDHFIYLKSESRAIRAFLHFDLLRAFAKNYVDAPEELAIPYIDAFEKRVFAHLPANEVVDLIIKDLDFAEENLESIEPLIGKTYYDVEYEDELIERRYRFNYFAILAIKARLYQYTGQYVLASSYAQRVIDEYPFDWLASWNVRSDQTFSKENVLTLDIYNLYEQYGQDFGADNYTTGNSYNEYAKTKIFDVVTGGVGADDLRYEYCFGLDEYGKKNISTKYSNQDKPEIPLIKISEMYMILSENLIETDTEQAVNLVNEIRSKRKVDLLNHSISKEQLLIEITNEFRKETYLEGQIFYMYKRLQLDEINALYYKPIQINSSNYTFPMPENEIEFGDGFRN